MSRPPWLPYATPDESELPGRPGYEITQESRFDDPDAQHLPSCPCAACIDAGRCQKCGKRGGRVDCSTCRILAMTPHLRLTNPYPDNDGSENSIRRRGLERTMQRQRAGDKPGAVHACRACGCADREKLWLVRDEWECLHHLRAECVARVASARLRLVKVEQP